MAKYSLVDQSKIERVARALYDAPQNNLLWDDIDDDLKQEFRAMSASWFEAISDKIYESLR